MTGEQVGLAASSALALYCTGWTAWVFREYLRRLMEIRRSQEERRSGLLPGHVASVSAWSIAAVIRMILRDQWDGPPPLWLDWPATVVLTAWLAASVLLVRLHYGRTRTSTTLRHPPQR